MKNVLKQLGKAVCYYVLFLGMQVVMTIVFSFVYEMKVAIELAVSGAALDPNALIQEATEFLMTNLNLISLLAGFLTILFLWIFFLIRKKKLTKETGITSLAGTDAVYMILLGIILAITISFGMSLLPESWLEAYGEQVQYTTNGSQIIMVIASMIMAPLVEEIIFRGLILSRLQKAMPVGVAVAITSLAFGLAHGQILWIAYTTVLGIIMSLVVLKTKSLTASILLHMVFNIFGTVVPALCGGITSVVVCAIVAAIGVAITVVLLMNFLKASRQ